MKRWKMITLLILPAAGLSLLAGCGTCRYAGGESTLAPVEIAPADQVEILWADAHETDGRLILHGALRRRHTDIHLLRAHVDVEIQTADGARQLQTPDVWLPRRLPGKGPDFERFNVELPRVGSAPAAIRLRPHAGEHAANPET